VIGQGMRMARSRSHEVGLINGRTADVI